MSRANPRFRRINPSLPAVGSTQGVVLYRVRGTIEGQMTLTGFHLLAANNNPTQGQLNSLLLDLSTNVFPAIKNCSSADWVTVTETLDVVHRTDIIGAKLASNAGVIGGRPAGHLPTEVAAILLKQTIFKGQHGRGRMSLPAIASADVTASTITAAAMSSALGVLGIALTTTRTDGTNVWTPCVAQRGNTSPRFVVAAANIVSTQKVLLLGTIRRRKIGRGK
jgi:hypothetical protein